MYFHRVVGEARGMDVSRASFFVIDIKYTKFFEADIIAEFYTNASKKFDHDKNKNQSFSILGLTFILI